METVETVKASAAAKIAERWFKSATFTPLVGVQISCSAYIKTTTELEPDGFESLTPESKTIAIYKKSQIADSLIEKGSYFTIAGTKYTVEGPDETDGEIFGKVVVKTDAG